MRAVGYSSPCLGLPRRVCFTLVPPKDVSGVRWSMPLRREALTEQDISPCHQLPCLVPASPRVPQQEHVLLSPSVFPAQHISWGFSVPPSSPEPVLVLAGIFVFVYSKTFTVSPAPWQLQSVGLMLVCSLELVVRPAGRSVFAIVIVCCVTFLAYSGSQSKLNAK